MKKIIILFSVLALAALLLPNVVFAQEPVECESEYTVQAGDWLSKIADKYYGNPLAYEQLVVAANAADDDVYTNIDNANLIEPGWLLCIPSDGNAAAGPQLAPEGLSMEALGNATYQGIYEQPITLVDGKYEGEPFVEGGAARPTVVMAVENPAAYGDLTGDGQDDAVVHLAENSGGSGVFSYLAIVVNQNGQPVNVATTLLGDRIRMNLLTIEDGQVVVDMIQPGPNDPACCPTQHVVKTFALQGGQLVETSSQEVTDEQMEDDSSIVGIIWNWQGFKDQAEKNDIVVPNPDSYRLELLPDGQYGFKADCNVGSGTYTLDGSSLTFQPGPVTLAECEPGSLYNEYLSLLGQVVTYVRDGDNLHLNLFADAGNMNFSKLHAVTGRIIGSEGATFPDGSKVEIRVDDVSLADAPATQIGGQIIFDIKQFPIDFEAAYNAAAIDPRHTYGLNVRISDSQDKLLYINTQAYNVLTRGFPTYNVEVMVDKVN